MRGIVLFTIFISFQSVIFSAVTKVPGDYPTIQQAIDAAVAGDNGCDLERRRGRDGRPQLIS